MSRDLHDTVTTYLRDIHAIEAQSLQQLESAEDVAGEPALASLLRDHLPQTRLHAARVRRLLDDRGAEPSRVKDALMRAGGEGFVLFARVQSDTPGKLAAHLLAYEAFEWAAYDLLARIADGAGEPDVARAMRETRDQEQEMMDAVETLFDRTVAASLEATSDEALLHDLGNYLADAHAIEAQAIELCEAGLEMMEDSTWTALFEERLSQTTRHRGVLQQRLGVLGRDRSLVKDAALRLGGLNWGMFFRAQPDTQARFAAFVYAFQFLKIGGYEQLKRVAERAADTGTAVVAQQILLEERRAAQRFAAAFDTAVREAQLA